MAWQRQTIPLRRHHRTSPAEYDKYLSHFFGNYMQLPPVEQRVEKHLRYYLNMEKRETWQEISKKLL